MADQLLMRYRLIKVRSGKLGLSEVTTLAHIITRCSLCHMRETTTSTTTRRSCCKHTRWTMHREWHQAVGSWMMKPRGMSRARLRLQSVSVSSPHKFSLAKQLASHHPQRISLYAEKTTSYRVGTQVEVAIFWSREASMLWIQTYQGSCLTRTCLPSFPPLGALPNLLI